MTNIDDLKRENLKLKKDIDYIYDLLEIEKMKNEYHSKRVKKLQKQLEEKQITI